MARISESNVTTSNVTTSACASHGLEVHQLLQSSVFNASMVPQPKKLGRVLKSAASSATRLKPIRGVSRRAAMTPQPGESPAVLLRVQVVSGKDLLSKDKSGASDP